MDYTEKPEYGRVVDICTKDALRELATPGLLAVLAPDRGRLLARRRRARLVPRGRDRHRHADGGLPRQLRWRVGQRQEARRGRPPRRQGQRGPRRDRHRRHRRRPVQGHRGPGDQPAAEGDEPGGAADRARRWSSSRYGEDANLGVRIVVAVVSIAVIVGAVYVSKRRGIAMGDDRQLRDDAGAPSRPTRRWSRSRRSSRPDRRSRSDGRAGGAFDASPARRRVRASSRRRLSAPWCKWLQ